MIPGVVIIASLLDHLALSVHDWSCSIAVNSDVQTSPSSHYEDEDEEGRRGSTSRVAKPWKPALRNRMVPSLFTINFFPRPRPLEAEQGRLTIQLDSSGVFPHPSVPFSAVWIFPFLPSCSCRLAISAQKKPREALIYFKSKEHYNSLARSPTIPVYSLLDVHARIPTLVMRLNFLSALLLSILTSSLCHDHVTRNEKRSVVVETIHRFTPNLNISLENLAVRQTGEIIVTFDSEPTIYQIEPEVNGTETFIYTFEGYTDLHGIVEVQPDQFYVTAGNLSLVNHIDVLGSCSVFHVNMTRFPDYVEVNKVADFPNSRILNGMALLSKEEGLVYIADSRVGIVNILNVLARYLIVFTGIIGRVPIHDSGLASGAAEVVAGNLTTPEDFILDTEGNIFLALFQANQFIRIDAHTHEITVLAGSPDSSEYKWAAAVEFGRRESDKDSLYATIDGGYLESDNVGGTVESVESLRFTNLKRLTYEFHHGW
ncbi:hypothetical protein LENED_004852 [Lentinula edodes]|uniref:Six-bladed beta-propeller-like protein n=1 Tax=Lentinula edodes TaxID=5353 RepID=A0A1Q3E7K2_LENED|nr:hypothetical protein LENED_004852 [Lentinula edodes]